MRRSFCSFGSDSLHRDCRDCFRLVSINLAGECIVFGITADAAVDEQWRHLHLDSERQKV